MTLRFAVAALAAFTLAAPAMATRHADVVYLQQLKARQKLLAQSGAPAKAKTETAKVEPAKPATQTAGDAASR